MSAATDFRPYREGDEKQILELFSLTFGGRQMPLSYWRWRFRDNPSGQGVIKLSWDYGLLAAHYAVTRVSMSIDGCDRLAGLTGTVMTHPTYRGRGLFSKLARRTYMHMMEIGMALVWGFPNTVSHRGFTCDLGWQDIYEVPAFRLKIESGKTTPTISPSKICELSEADERFNQFWERIRNDYDIIVRRDRKYINWRYFSNPIEKYRLIAYVENEQIRGFAVFKRYQDEMQVVDLLIGKEDIEVGESLMQFIIAEALDATAQSVSLWLNVTHPFHHALEKMGFRPEGPVTYLGGLVLNPKFDGSLYDFRRWYFTMGDSDVF